MATKALNYTTSEINQRLNLAGTAVQPNALNDYYTKSEVDGKVVVDLSVRYSASYANLSAALAALDSDATATNIKKGGMSIKFINSTTNKYEQWNLKASSWSTNTSDWALDVDGSIGVLYLKAVGTDYSEVGVGEYYYNTSNKLIRYRVSASTWETVPYSNVSICRFRNNLYVPVNNELVNVNSYNNALGIRDTLETWDDNGATKIGFANNWYLFASKVCAQFAATSVNMPTGQGTYAIYFDIEDMPSSDQLWQIKCSLASDVLKNIDHLIVLLLYNPITGAIVYQMPSQVVINNNRFYKYFNPVFDTKIIRLKAVGTDYSEVGVGEYYYNTTTKLIRHRVGASTWETVPEEDNILCVYNDRIYFPSGNDGLVDALTDVQKLSRYLVSNTTSKTTGWNSGYFVSAITGELVSSNNSRYVIMECENAYKIEFEASKFSGDYGYAFFDKDGLLISAHKTDATEHKIVSVPANAVEFRLSWVFSILGNNQVVDIIYVGLGDRLSELATIANGCVSDIERLQDNFFIRNEDFLLLPNMITLDDILLKHYVRANGTEGNAIDWCCTNYIPVIEGEVYTAFDYKTTHVALYDANKVIITDKTWQSGEPIPTGVAYIRLNQSNRRSWVEITLEDVTLALVRGTADENPGFTPFVNPRYLKLNLAQMLEAYSDADSIYKPFKGKKVFCAGDSQTMYGYYFDELLRTTGMTMIGNTGTLGNGGTSIQLTSFLQTMDSQGLIDWDNIDIFTVLVGGNDYGSNSQKGSFSDDETANTIYGGIKKVIKYVLGKNRDIRMVFFTRPERDNVESTGINSHQFDYVTTKKLSGITSVTYTGSTDYVAIAGYDSEGNFVRNILTSGTYANEVVNIPNDCPLIRISSKGSGLSANFSFELSTGITLTEQNIEPDYREKSSNVLPEGYLLNNTYGNMYIYENGYCDNRRWHYAPGANLAGVTQYEVGQAILDCAKRMGCAGLDTHDMCGIVYGYNLRKYMPDGTHFNRELGARMGRLMGRYINTLG